MFTKFYYLIAFALGIIAIQSCQITQDYTRSVDYKIAAYRTEKINSDTASMASYQWKDFFGDEILLAYIQEGLNQNLDLLKVNENLRIANAYLNQAKASFYPTASADARYSYSTLSNETFGGLNIPNGTKYADIKLGVSLSWEIDAWGKLKSEKKAAIADFMQTESAQHLVKSELVSAIATNYYLLLSLDAKKAIILSNINNREEGVTTIKALKQAGLVTEVAVKQNEAQLYNAQAQLVDIEKDLKLVENSMSLLLGKTPQSFERNALEEQKIIPDLEIGIPIQLLDNRPDVLAAEYNLIGAFELTNVARANFYPRLSIGAAGGLNSQNFNDLFNLRAIYTNFLANLTQPILNQRRLKTQKEVQLSAQEIALLDYKKTVLTAYKEVSDVVYAYEANTEILGFKQKENDALTKAIAFSEELQSQGLANYLEVLVAKDNALRTELALVDIELNRLNLTVALYKALGGGWR